jgi:hypothetical protein
MNIGDKVRLLHGKEEGIIRRIIDQRLIEVEIEDGFLIPVLKNEIVRIASEEKENFKSEVHIGAENSIEIDDDQSLSDEGLFLALITQERILSGWVINSTNNTILFSVHVQNANEVKGVSHGILNKFSYAKIDDWPLNNLLNLPLLIIDVIQFDYKKETHIPPITKKVDITPKVINRKHEKIPLLKSNGVIISLIEDNIIPDPNVIKAALYSRDPEIKSKDILSNKNLEEVDLHIESLVDNTFGLDNAEILNIQLSHFEDSLEKAVISGIDQITFIHGIGNGTLRYKIHKKLSQYPHIKYFEDAKKEKFGFGATKVHLK